MKKKHLIAAGLAMFLAVTASLGTAWAYFTTYATAKGSYTIHLGDETTINEHFSGWKKSVSIVNDAKSSQPVFVRVKGFCGSAYSLVYSDESGKWSPGADGYYYFSDPVAPGAETPNALDVSIRHADGSQITTEEAANAADFHVVIVFESTPVVYNADGAADWKAADWNAKVDTGTAEGGK